MNKKKAQAAIKEQIDKLDADECALYGMVWISQTRSYLRLIFGDASQEVKAFSNFIAFDSLEYHELYGAANSHDVEWRTTEARKLLHSLVDTLNYKEPIKIERINYLKRLTDRQIVIYSSIGLIISFSLGVLAGRSNTLGKFLDRIIDILL